MKTAHLHVMPQVRWKSRKDYLIFLRHIKAYDFTEETVRNKSVLELGCGAGYGNKHLSRIVKSIVGADIGMDVLLEFQKKNLLSNIFLSHCNGTNLPFTDESFDVVISFQVIEHIANVPDYLSEIKRVLRNRGVFCLSTPIKRLRLLPL